MSGPDVAAFFGLANVSIRGILLAHQAAADWKNAPETIEALAKETSTLQQTLSILLDLQDKNSETREIADRIGLLKAITACEEHCTRLERHFSLWKSSASKYRVKARCHYIFHRKELANLLADTQVAKQTTILSVYVAQLSFQLQSPMPLEEQNEEVIKVSEQIEEVERETRSSDEVIFGMKESKSVRKAHVVENQVQKAVVTTEEQDAGGNKIVTADIVSAADGNEFDGTTKLTVTKVGASSIPPSGLHSRFSNNKTAPGSKSDIIGLSLE